jgi:ribosome-associated protein
MNCMSKSTHKRAAATTATADLPEQVIAAVLAAADKKAQGLAVLDLREAAGFTDFFVIATGQNARQIRAIAEAVEDRLRELGVKPSHAEGYDRTEWVLLDYFDFVVHVFSAGTRAFYGLERLWGSATIVDISELIGPPGTAPQS